MKCSSAGNSDIVCFTLKPGVQAGKKQLLALETYEVNKTAASAKASRENLGPSYGHLKAFHVEEVTH